MITFTITKPLQPNVLAVLISEEIVEDDLRGKTIKITDFGLAREVAHTTRMSAAGTYVIVLLLVAYGHAVMYIKSNDFIEMHMVYTAGFAILIAVHWNALTTLGAAVSCSTCGFIFVALACEIAEKESSALHDD